jgi:vacuolar protein sorting-associated protein 13A/C
MLTPWFYPFSMLGLKNVFMTREEFVNLVQEHYKGQLLSQVYTILGSFEFLGSPLSLVNNLGTGVYDFFYEPAQGLVKVPSSRHTPPMSSLAG